MTDRDDTHINPTSIDVDIGEEATFFCNSVNETKWFFNDGQLPLNKVDSPVERLLYIQYIKPYNDGIYTCYGRKGVSQRDQYFVAKSTLTVYGNYDLYYYYYLKLWVFYTTIMILHCIGLFCFIFSTFYSISTKCVKTTGEKMKH